MVAKRALVTGGAGFLGSHLVDELMQREFFVRVVDNLSNGGLENLSRWRGNAKFEFVRGDLKDPVVAEKCADDVDIAFHFAANPDVRMGATDPSVHFDENLLVTFNILEAIRRSDGAKRIVFASSSTVYGEPILLPTPEDYGPLLPISVYGASKLGCEALISSYCHTFGLRGVILRFANIVGSRAMHGVIVDFVRKLRDDSSVLEILGDGKQKKSYLHVSDLIRAVLFVSDSFGKEDKVVDVFNVGSTDQVDVRRIGEVVCEEMGIERPRFRYNMVVKDGRGWVGDVKVMSLSVEKLMGLGWSQAFGSEEAVRISCRELVRKTS
jgi:UDP-glucose 4-epimerase